jgi:hypothetical protein
LITLRLYQNELAAKGVEMLKTLGIAYLAMEVRTGKTLTALEIARLYGAKSVLFLTKKKAIASIEGDYTALNPGYALDVANDEGLHKIDPSAYDLVVHDEHHRFGAFPKPGKAVQQFKGMFGHLPHIYLSGTPSPESYSQLYHQFWVSDRSPFPHRNFYAWAKAYVNVRQRVFAHGTINDYSEARLDEIAPIIEPYMLRFTQADAGFVSTIDEQILWVDPSPRLLGLIDRLKEDWVIEGRQHVISAPTAVSLQSKLHQLYSGTILFDPVEGQPRASLTLDTFKVDFIRKHFEGQKLVIFHKFAQERKAILEGLSGLATDDIEEFRKTDKSIVLQIISGREGLNLSEADAIVFYNIDFAALSYWQARDRMTTMVRKESKVFWLFSTNGIEEKIYEAVTNKLDYTVSIFRKDFGIRHSKPPNKAIREQGILCRQVS